MNSGQFTDAFWSEWKLCKSCFYHVCYVFCKGPLQRDGKHGICNLIENRGDCGRTDCGKLGMGLLAGRASPLIECSCVEQVNMVKGKAARNAEEH